MFQRLKSGKPRIGSSEFAGTLRKQEGTDFTKKNTKYSKGSKDLEGELNKLRIARDSALGELDSERKANRKRLSEKDSELKKSRGENDKLQRELKRLTKRFLKFKKFPVDMKFYNSHESIPFSHRLQRLSTVQFSCDFTSFGAV